MSRDITISILLDFYKELLTAKQANALDLYYNMDYSLSEIAENVGVTRQGVRAFIKKGEDHLKEFESKLRMVQRFMTIENAVEKLRELNKSVDKALSDEINKYIDIISKANDMEL